MVMSLIKQKLNKAFNNICVWRKGAVYEEEDGSHICWICSSAGS